MVNRFRRQNDDDDRQNKPRQPSRGRRGDPRQAEDDSKRGGLLRRGNRDDDANQPGRGGPPRGSKGRGGDKGDDKDKKGGLLGLRRSKSKGKGDDPGKRRSPFLGGGAGADDDQGRGWRSPGGPASPGGRAPLGADDDDDRGAFRRPGAPRSASRPSPFGGRTPLGGREDDAAGRRPGGPPARPASRTGGSPLGGAPRRPLGLEDDDDDIGGGRRPGSSPFGGAARRPLGTEDDDIGGRRPGSPLGRPGSRTGGSPLGGAPRRPLGADDDDDIGGRRPGGPLGRTPSRPGSRTGGSPIGGSPLGGAPRRPLGTEDDDIGGRRPGSPLGRPGSRTGGSPLGGAPRRPLGAEDDDAVGGRRPGSPLGRTPSRPGASPFGGAPRRPLGAEDDDKSSGGLLRRSPSGRSRPGDKKDSKKKGDQKDKGGSRLGFLGRGSKKGDKGKGKEDDRRALPGAPARPGLSPGDRGRTPSRRSGRSAPGAPDRSREAGGFGAGRGGAGAGGGSLALGAPAAPARKSGTRAPSRGAGRREPEPAPRRQSRAQSKGRGAPPSRAKSAGTSRRAQSRAAALPAAKKKTATSLHQGLDYERKIDLIGIVLLALAGVSFFAVVPSVSMGVLPPVEGGLTGTLNQFLSQIFGWGKIVVPFAALAVGVWLMLERFSDTGLELDYFRIIGILVLFGCALTWIQMFQLVDDTAATVADFRPISYDLAIEDGEGGGWFGHQFYVFLLAQLGDWGTLSVLIAWLVVGLMLTFDLSVVELGQLVAGAFAFLRLRPGERRQKRLAAKIANAEAVPDMRPGETQQLPLAAAVAAAGAGEVMSGKRQTIEAGKAPGAVNGSDEERKPLIRRRSAQANGEDDAESGDTPEAVATPEAAPALAATGSAAASDRLPGRPGGMPREAREPSDKPADESEDRKPSPRLMPRLRRSSAPAADGEEASTESDAAPTGDQPKAPGLARTSPPGPADPAAAPAKGTDDGDESASKRRGLFFRRSRGKAKDNEQPDASEAPVPAETAASEAAPTADARDESAPRRGLLPWRRSKPKDTGADKAAESDAAKPGDASAPGDEAKTGPRPAAALKPPTDEDDEAKPAGAGILSPGRRPGLAAAALTGAAALGGLALADDDEDDLDDADELDDDDEADEIFKPAPAGRPSPFGPGRPGGEAGMPPRREMADPLGGPPRRNLPGDAGETPRRELSDPVSGPPRRNLPGDAGDTPRREMADPLGGPPRRELSDPVSGPPRRGLPGDAGETPRREMADPLNGPPRRPLPGDAGETPRREMADPLGGPPRRNLPGDAGEAPRREMADPLSGPPRRNLPGDAGETPRREMADPLGGPPRRPLPGDAANAPRREMAEALGGSLRRDAPARGTPPLRDPAADKADEDNKVDTGARAEALAAEPVKPDAKPEAGQTPETPPAPKPAEPVTRPDEPRARPVFSREELRQRTGSDPALRRPPPGSEPPKPVEATEKAGEAAKTPEPDADATEKVAPSRAEQTPGSMPPRRVLPGSPPAGQPAAPGAAAPKPAAPSDSAERPAPPIRRPGGDRTQPAPDPERTRPDPTQTPTQRVAEIARERPEPSRRPEPAAPAATGSSAPKSRIVSNKKDAKFELPEWRKLLRQGDEQRINDEVLLDKARVIEDTLMSFGAPGKVVEVNPGPVITQFGVEPDYLVARSGKRTRVKVGSIARLDADLALALAARTIRIEAPVPGKGFVGIEVPNDEVALVGLYDIMDSPEFRRIDSKLRIALGLSVDGTPVAADLTAMPHLLVAGTTGSGKSVCVNSIIASLLVQNTPDDVQFIMVDPKRVELTGYNGIPHLVAPVVVDLERIVGVLQWVQREMEERYRKFAEISARNILDYNKKIGTNEKKMPYYVVVVDELADLMMLAPDETERLLARLAQMARATGIHLIISTQRPSVDIITGLIKANFPARIAFAVASSVDSRVILDQPGAEKLLGRGDMLYQSPDAAAPLRMQGVFVSDEEINKIASYWKGALLEESDAAALSSPSRDVSFPTRSPGRSSRPRAKSRPAQPAFWDEEGDVQGGADFIDEDGDGRDDMYDEAVELVQRLNKASISLLQRRLRIGYTRAARLIDIMEQEGIVGPAESGSKPREVLKGNLTSSSGD